MVTAAIGAAWDGMVHYAIWAEPLIPEAISLLGLIGCSMGMQHTY